MIGARFEWSTQRYIEESKWMVSAGKVKGITEEAKSINAYLDVLKHKVFVYHRELTFEHKELSCYTGFAYADVYKLKRSEIKTGIDSKQWIFANCKKNDELFRIPLLPVSLQLLEKYAAHPECIVRDRMLPVLTNQKMNSYLKKLLIPVASPKN